MFTEGGLQVCHLLEVVDESWSHLTLEQWVSPKEICYHFIFTDQSISERKTERKGDKGKEDHERERRLSLIGAPVLLSQTKFVFIPKIQQKYYRAVLQQRSPRLNFPSKLLL